jgi:hypothetical protein
MGVSYGMAPYTARVSSGYPIKSGRSFQIAALATPLLTDFQQICPMSIVSPAMAKTIAK